MGTDHRRVIPLDKQTAHIFESKRTEKCFLQIACEQLHTLQK